MATRTIDDLSPKELAFCEFYTALGEDTCGNGTASALKAGYAEASAGNRAWKLLHRPPIRAKIAEIHKTRMDKFMINPERILYDLEHTRIKGLALGDATGLSVACRASELQGKTLAMFVDRSDINHPETRQQLTAEEREILSEAGNRINLAEAIKAHEEETAQQAAG